MKCAISRGDPPLTSLLFFLFLLQISLTGQFFNVRQVSQLPPEFHSVFSLNSNTIYAAGDYGTVIKSTDGGQNWVRQSIPLYQALRKIKFINDTLGIAIGHSSNIFLTTNSGALWQQRNLPVSGLVLFDVHFPDKKTGYITGTGGRVFKTTDHGFNWFQAGWPADADFRSIAFSDTLTGYIVTSSGECYKSTDGGENWVLKHTGIFSTFYDIHIINKNFIFLSGTGGSLVRSTDAGETWQLIPTNAHVILRSITFSDSLNGFLCGDAGVLLKTSDGGLTWNNIRTSSVLNFNSVHSTIPSEVYIASEKGKIIKFSSVTGWSEYEYAKPPHFYAVKVLGSNFIQVAGSRGSIYVTPDGSNWYNHSISMSGALRSIDYYGQTQGWICGDSGVIVRTTNGGNSWTPVASGTTVNLRGISEAGFNNALAVGENGLIISTSNNGAFWTTQNSGTSQHLNAISFADSSFGLAVGNNGTVLKTSNRGLNWSLVPLPFSDNLYAVEFANANLCAAAGDSGRIIWSTDKGESWLINTPDTKNPYRGISFGSLTDVYLVALTKAPYWYSWGSSTGYPIFFIVNDQYSVNAVSMIDNNTGALAANDGLIFRRNYNPVIPVELVLFSAQPSSGAIILEWETVTETNNQSFEIQKISDNGFWSTIALIEGKGSTTSRTSYIYTDNAPLQGLNQYRLAQRDYDGSVHIVGETEAYYVTEAMFHLSQNYPNPFNPETKISYCIPAPGMVSLVLYDALGRQASVLVNEERPAGTSEITLNAEHLASGVYYYMMVSGGYTQYRKLMVVK